SLALADDLLDLLADGLERDVQRLEGLGRNPFALVDQTEQDVLGADVIVIEHPRFFLSEDNHAPGPVGEPFEHVSVPWAGAPLSNGLEDRRTRSYPRGRLGAPAAPQRALEAPHGGKYTPAPRYAWSCACLSTTPPIAGLLTRYSERNGSGMSRRTKVPRPPGRASASSPERAVYGIDNVWARCIADQDEASSPRSSPLGDD